METDDELSKMNNTETESEIKQIQSPTLSDGSVSSNEIKIELSPSQLHLKEEQPQTDNVRFQDVPSIRFRDVVLAKKFGRSPYDNDRYDYLILDYANRNRMFSL